MERKNLSYDNFLNMNSPVTCVPTQSPEISCSGRKVRPHNSYYGKILDEVGDRYGLIGAMCKERNVDEHDFRSWMGTGHFAVKTRGKGKCKYCGDKATITRDHCCENNDCICKFLKERVVC